MPITQERLLKLLEAAEQLNLGFNALFEDIFDPNMGLLRLQFDAKDLKQRLFEPKLLIANERGQLNLRWKRNDAVRKYRKKVREANGNYQPSEEWQRQFRPKSAKLPAADPNQEVIDRQKIEDALGDEMTRGAREMGFLPAKTLKASHQAPQALPAEKEPELEGEETLESKP